MRFQILGIQRTGIFYKTQNSTKMTTIQIVTNSDRCHCSVNGVPAATFIFSDYPERNEESKKSHAIADAKIECFNQLAKFDNGQAHINPNIVSK